MNIQWENIHGLDISMVSYLDHPCDMQQQSCTVCNVERELCKTLPGPLRHHSLARVVAAACGTFHVATFSNNSFQPLKIIKVYFVLDLYCTKLFSMWQTFSAVFSARSNTSAIYVVITGTEEKVVTYREIRDI